MRREWGRSACTMCSPFLYGDAQVDLRPRRGAYEGDAPLYCDHTSGCRLPLYCDHTSGCRLRVQGGIVGVEVDPR